jgi:rhodanese-related sulfurtransferase
MADERELTPAETKARLEAGEIQLIDVRTQEEWDAGHIPEARHIELDDLTAQAGTIDSDRAVVFSCSGGNRSEMAADAFRASGFEAYNLAGGLKAWIDAGLPVES